MFDQIDTLEAAKQVQTQLASIYSTTRPLYEALRAELATHIAPIDLASVETLTSEDQAAFLMERLESFTNLDLLNDVVRAWRNVSAATVAINARVSELTPST